MAGWWNQIRRLLLPSGVRRAPPNANGRYCAFISYRHRKADRRAAKWLHRELETYRVPRPLRDRLGRTGLGRAFRDEEELSVTPYLGAEIIEALDRSDWLIVVCSPATRESTWVAQEVHHVINSKGIERVLLLLIEGEPKTAFPSALRGREDELLAADIRPHQEDTPTLRRRLAKLRLFAGLLGVDFDELRNREGERRRRRRVLLMAASMSAVLVLGTLSLLADANRLEAERIARQARHSAAEILRQVGDTAFAAGNHLSAEDAFARALLQEDSTSLRERLLEVRTRELGLDWIVPPRNNGHLLMAVPKTRRVLAVFADNDVTAWHLDSSAELGRLHPHEATITGLAVSPDGTRAASVDMEGHLALFDPSTLEVLARADLGPPGFVRIGFQTDGTLLAIRPSVILGFAPGGLDAPRSFPIEGPVVTAAALEPTLGRLVLGRQDGTVTVLTERELAPVRTFATGGGRVLAVALDPEGERLAAWGESRQGTAQPVHLFRVADGNLVPGPPLEFGFPRPDALYFLPDGRLAIGQIAQGFVVWDPAIGVSDFQPQVGATSAFVLDTVSDSLLAIGDRLTRWDLATKTERRIATGHTRSTQALIFTPDGSEIVSGGIDGEVLRWNAATGAPLPPLEAAGDTLGGLVLSADGAFLGGCGWSGLVLWDMASGRVIQRLGYGSGISLQQCVAVTRGRSSFWVNAGAGELIEIDPVTLASGASLTLPGEASEIAATGEPGGFVLSVGQQVWLLGPTLPTGQPYTPTFSSAVTSLALSGDGEFLAAADNKTLHLWRLDAPAAPLWSASFEQANALTFSPDGHRIAVAEFDRITVFDAFTGRVEARLDPTPRYSSHINTLTFSPDGWSLAVGADGGSLSLWRFEQGQLARTIRSPARHVEDGFFPARAAFSSDGSRLLLREPDNALSLWDLTTITEIARRRLDGARSLEAYGDGFVVGSSAGLVRVLGRDLSILHEVGVGNGEVEVFAVQLRKGAPSRLGLALGPPGQEPTIAAVWTDGPKPRLRKLGTFPRMVLDMDFDPCGDRVAVSSSNPGEVRIYDLAQETAPILLPGHDATVTAVSFSPDCRWIATSARDDRLRIFEAVAGAPVIDFEGQRSETEAFKDYVEDVAFSPDGTRLYSAAGDRAVRVWDVGTWRELHALRGFTDPWVQDVTLDPKGRRLFAFSGDKVARLWSLDEVERLLTAPPVELRSEVLRRVGWESLPGSTTNAELPSGLPALARRWLEIRLGLWGR